MESDGGNNSGAVNVSGEDDSRSAVNSLILDYYKKFGRKRDLEQYFSLSTAQSDIRDPSSLFWRRMKAQNDSSDSGEKKSESSTELCRISIKCSVPESSSSQDENQKTKSDSESPPIITEDVVPNTSQHSDNESEKSDDNHSRKSMDVTLDTSTNKAISPTSSITSQRKLEWDSLADVGYANESDRKTSASSLSTLERLALKQQYSNNDTKQDSDIGLPTAQSTPVDQNDNKNNKKNLIKKTTKIYKKDIDFVEVNVPHSSGTNPSQAINVNLTKHISFNVEKNGGVTVENVKQNVTVQPEKVSVETEVTPQVKMDKEIQTSLKSREKSSSSLEMPKVPKTVQLYGQGVPVFINLNSLKRKKRRHRLRTLRRKLRSKRKSNKEKLNVTIQEKSAEQVSEAESFEYMPGHIYNQNHMKDDQSHPGNTTSNKSSLESSGARTTDSSKGSKYSFTKDLERSIDLLKAALQQRYDDSNVKNKLIKEIVQRILSSRYRDDESTTDFLSGLSFGSKKLGLREDNYTTTSTSDGNNTNDKDKSTRPRKSILRVDKFNPNAIASTSQSAPNLPSVINSEKPVASSFVHPLISSNTESDMSSKGKNSSDNVFAKTHSEELYQKYMEALRKEEAYKEHLRDKEIFLRQKLVKSDTAFKVPRQTDMKTNNRLKELMKDLTRNNYDDGSGDASKLEIGSNANMDFERYYPLKQQRSHSVFTLSSCNSDSQNKKGKLKNRCPNETSDGTKPGTSKDDHHYCCCPYHSTNAKIGVTDSSVQVNIKYQREEESSLERQSNKQPDMIMSNQNQGSNNESPRNIAHVVSDNLTGDIKYVCVCADKAVVSKEIPDNFLIYKCSRLRDRGVQLEQTPSKTSNTVSVQCTNENISPKHTENTNGRLNIIETNSVDDILELRRTSKSSQTNVNLALNMLRRKSSDRSVVSSSSSENKIREFANSINNLTKPHGVKDNILIHEATRCIQTEISINPKISDPSLSDINIIGDSECVKLIRETYREISKLTSVSDINNGKDQDDLVPEQYTGKEYLSDNVLAPEDDSESKQYDKVKNNGLFIAEPRLNKEIQSDINQSNIACQTHNIKNQGEIPENFTIPIQGTNMTLMVSIGSNVLKAPVTSKNKDAVTQEVATEEAKLIEKATSLSEECSKAVQSTNTDIFKQIHNHEALESVRDVDHNSNTVNKLVTAHNENKMSCFRKPYLVNESIAGEGLKYNTYPKNVQLKDRKPFRSYTDTDDFDSGRGVQTNHIDKRDVEIQQDFSEVDPQRSKETIIDQSQSDKNTSSNKSSRCADSCEDSKRSLRLDARSQKFSSDSEKYTKPVTTKDPILEMIQNITKRYSKKDIEKSKRKKCFKEIITVLNYLLDTEDSTDHDQIKSRESFTPPDNDRKSNIKKIQEKDSADGDTSLTKKLIDKGVQSLAKKLNKDVCNTKSSEIPISTDIPGTSSDSATCKVLNKIKKECEKYHQKRCKSSHSSGKKCEASSSTSVNCERCKRVHHCQCRGHKCKVHKQKSTIENIKKKCVAYNLIIQTSDSMLSEETVYDKNCKPLQNIIVKVPSKRKQVQNVPFKEMSAKIEKKLLYCSPRCSGKSHRSRSWPNESEISSTEEYRKKTQAFTVRDYLEKNRPDFVEKCSKRQNCLKFVSESRANERAAQRELLSVQLAGRAVSAASDTDLRRLADELGLRRNRIAPKFISEREMKKHSEKIYKSLPEVTRKKEEAKKENIKKTNLLMANIFKKNLQKKTLRGSVNISNYSTVIKI